MAKIEKKKISKTVKRTIESPFSIYWDSSNYFLLALGVLLAIIGFVFMTAKPWDGTSALFISPIFLFLAYLVAFPLAVFIKKRKVEDKQGN